MKAEMLQEKADEKAEIAQTIDKEFIKVAHKAQTDADTALRAAAKQAEKAKATVARIAQKSQSGEYTCQEGQEGFKGEEG